MRQILKVFIVSILSFPFFAHSQGLMDPQEIFVVHASAIQSQLFETIPMQDKGRIKPFHTFARESILFLTGSYRFAGLDAVQVYLGLVGFSEIEKLKVINVRHSGIRKALGLKSDERYFSPSDLEHSPLNELANPLLEKEQKNSRSLEPNEKHILEIFNQYWFLKQINVGEHFLRALDATAQQKDQAMHAEQEPSVVVAKGQEVLRALMSGQMSDAHAKIPELIDLAKTQERPEILRSQVGHADLEVTYNKTRPFFIAAVLFLLFGISLILKWPKIFFTGKLFQYLMPLPFIPLVIGFYMRITITGFAPVTNMYGTMLWVSFGVGLFSSLIWFLYRKNIFVGSLWIAAAGILFLTESLPLILSPDLDPIVAVLRSNLWLTIHVLTIVISYAAFAIAMVMGNITLVRSILTRIYNDEYIQDAAKTCYRMIQLGVFLLSVGIILGGVWADYSWGRFWGWDPKETWALIADLGFLSILHARFVGWIGPFGLLASSTVGFLLVIMAWYGVNFILAAGLHSYGFSSGGASMVAAFVIVQLTVLFTALSLYRKGSASRSSV